MCLLMLVMIIDGLVDKRQHAQHTGMLLLHVFINIRPPTTSCVTKQTLEGLLPRVDAHVLRDVAALLATIVARRAPEDLAILSAGFVDNEGALGERLPITLLGRVIQVAKVERRV